MYIIFLLYETKKKKWQENMDRVENNDVENKTWILYNDTVQQF